MAFLQLLPTILSLLIFCAHLFRNGFLVLVPLVLLFNLLLFVRHGLVARFFQVLLAGIAAERVLTAVFLAAKRADAGQPWVRSLLILGAVALFALFAATLYESEVLRRRYPRRLVF